MEPGEIIAGRYRLIRRIGAGGMGTVWAARHELLGKDFALKFATIAEPGGARGERERARFLREAQTVARLRHPNIVDLADIGEVTPSGELYLAMELLDGESLAERLARAGRIAPREAASIAGEVAGALAAAHHAGVAHSDVKPGNIFLAVGGQRREVPKLLDFGVSQAVRDPTVVTLTGQALGTPAYMSPEQALGELDVDYRTDLWSLGVVLYEMLSGERPFDAQSYPALLRVIADEPVPPLSSEVPRALAAVVEQCLAKQREDRFPSADALGEALESAISSIGRDVAEDSIDSEETVVDDTRARNSMDDQPVSPPPAEGRPNKRDLRIVALGACAIAGALVAVILLGDSHGSRESDRDAVRAPKAEVPHATAPAPAPSATSLGRASDMEVPMNAAGGGDPAPVPSVVPPPVPRRPVSKVNDPGF